ncbi:MAG TPA: S9 family peptidase [Bryobacteraceae bacterium]|jgi:dipeptidyl aminopeptidase/acylaminoacyl peptidase|nr:S9 family peptidase [Bryobacteraceae bacterium]
MSRKLAFIVFWAGAAMSADRLTVEKAIQVREPSDLHFSPDGRRVAFTVQEPPDGRGSARHIWVYDTATQETRQWTTSLKSESSPRWSPDGKYLAFLSDREENQQIWLMPSNSGEALQLTSGKNAVMQFQWSPDGKTIAFLAQDPPTAEEEKRQKDGADEHVVSDVHPARLWVVDLATKKTRRITAGAYAVREFEWMPDEKHFLVTATDQPDSDLRNQERIYSVSADDGKFTELAWPKAPFRGLRISPDGKSVAFVMSPADGPHPQDLFLAPIDLQSYKDITAARDRPVENFDWLNNSEIAALFADGFHGELDAVGGSVRKLASAGSLDITQFAVSKQGAVVYVAQSASVLPELWAEGKAVSHFNDGFNVALQKPEIFEYKSFDGAPIEAALFRGAGTREGQPAPAVMMIHGGPAGAWRNRFDALTQLLVARGYTVMQPNIRGSSGYGQKFLASNRGDWGGADFKDVMAGVDDLIRRKIADPNRLAIAGWSYGGYMAEWAITQTNRFKAAICGAGMADLATEFGTESHSAGDEWYYGTPYENHAGFDKSSPILYIKNAKTPTLILQGEADTTDPISQSQMLYRGLKRYNVPVVFVSYPREPHGLREQKHILDRYRRSVEFIERYLGAAGEGALSTAPAQGQR